MLGSSVDSQDLPEQLSVILCLSMQRKLIHLDKELKDRPFLSICT